MKHLRKLFILILPILVYSCSHIDMSYSNAQGLETEKTQHLTVQDSSIFYYYSGKKIYLAEHKDVLFISFRDKESKVQGIEELKNTYQFTSWRSKYQEKSITDNKNSNLAIIKSVSGIFSDEEISKIKERADVTHISHITEYKGQYAAPINQILVKLKKSSDYSKLQEWADKTSCKFIDNPWLGENVYLISVPKSYELTSVEVANQFVESGQFEYAAPDLYIFDAFCSNDTYYDQQWGLWDRGSSGQGNDINIENAWTITEGSGDISIAVIDTGVELTHPDLEGQLLTGYNSVNNTRNGSPIETTPGHAHGTAVAGIVGAKKDNNIGITGVAPNCKIIPINAANVYAMFSNSSLIAAINWAVNNGADVINFSLSSQYENNLLDNAITYAVAEGRNGKGCVLVGSSGNNSLSSVNYPSSHASVLAVGSSARNGQRKSNSNYGSGINVVAPGEDIYTLDLLDSAGYNSESSFNLIDKNYTFSFGDTSAAAPFVSGIAALILSKYPDLMQAQVRRAIELGCVRPSGYTYQNDNRTPMGLWNNQVGYGRVDAYAALQKAAYFQQENIANSTPGIDFEITNESSYTISNIYVGLTGTINGEYTVLFSCDPGSLDTNQTIGFPTYRGEDIDATPGTLITDLELEIYAECPDYSGNVRLSAHIDGLATSDLLSFDTGTTYYMPIADTTVPESSRKRLFMHITDPLN